MPTSQLVRLNLPSVTTTQRDALPNTADGQFVYNSTTATIQARQGGAWKDVPLDVVDLASLSDAAATLDADDKIVAIEDGNTVLATQAQLHRLLQFTTLTAGFDTGSSAQDITITGGDALLGSLILKGSTHGLPGPVRMANLMTSTDPTTAPGATISAFSASLNTDVLEYAGTVASAANVAYRTRVSSTSTTSATVANALVLTTAADTVYAVRAAIYARQTAGAGTVGHCAYYERAALFERTGATTRLVGAQATPVTIEDNTGWDANLSMAAANIRVAVTGEASKTIRWHVVLSYGLITT